MDTLGQVIIEAGYFGCPAIAPKSFGIPELIKDKETGFVIDLPFNADDFAKRILTMIEDRDSYLQMRKNVREHTISNLSFDVIGEKIISKIKEVIN